MTTLQEKVILDVTYLLTNRGKKCLVNAREDLLGQPEVRALSEATSEVVADFLWEEIVYRYGVFGRLVIDGGPENIGVAKVFIAKYSIKRVQISVYNSKANRGIKYSYRSIREALTRISRGGKRQRRHLPVVLLVERISIYGLTRVTPFSLIYGREVILPYETRFLVQRLLDQTKIKTREELLEVRAQ